MNPHLKAWTINSEGFPTDSYASDQLEHLLGYAILAPSPHNTQPWHFRINATDVDVYADLERRLMVTDPHGRALMMSCGAVLYNLRIATEYFEKEWRLSFFPDLPEPELVARFHLGLSAETSSEDIVLFHAIPQRTTHRGTFRPDPIPDELLSAWVAAAERERTWLMFADVDETRAALADLVAEADRRQWSDRPFRQELARWVRKRPEEAEDGLPVHDLGIQDWMSFAGPSIIRTFDRGKGQAARDHEIAEHAPVLAVLGTEEDNARAWLAAGQALQSLLLRARSEEVWASFLCQPLELPVLREQVASLCQRKFPQVILRMGYADPASPAPRRSLRNFLLPQHEAHRT
jgi:nitroreductase